MPTPPPRPAPSLRILTAVLGVLAGASAARAEVGASGTRLAVGDGPARYYMTYGHVEEPELYAPIVPELRRLDIRFERRGDEYRVYHRGQRVADWPVITSRQSLPETGDFPCVLVLGGNLFVPVRRLADLCQFDVRWAERTNFVTLVHNPDKPRRVEAPQPETPGAGQPVVLAGVDLEVRGNAVQVRVRAGGRVHAVWNTVTRPAPIRLFIDFPGAVWSPEATAPVPVGFLRAARIGHPQPDTARLVLEVPSLIYRVTRVARTDAELVAVVGIGRAAPPLKDSPEAPRTAAVNPRIRPGRLGSRSVLRPPFSIDRNLLLNATLLRGRIICVDAGHGGEDQGAAGSRFLEKELCLKMALAVRDQLTSMGATVVMTREDDVYPSLDERVALARQARAHVFISIHCNSTPRPNQAAGVETYWFTPQSRALAQALHPRVLAANGGLDRGIRNHRWRVLSRSTAPAVLLEVGFINNEDEEALIASEEFQQNLAQSLAMGLVDFFRAGEGRSLDE